MSGLQGKPQSTICAVQNKCGLQCSIYAQRSICGRDGPLFECAHYAAQEWPRERHAGAFLTALLELLLQY